MVGEVMDAREETTNTMSLNKYISNYFLNVYPYISTDNCSFLHLSKISFFLQKTEPNREIHNWSKCKYQPTVGYPFQIDLSTLQPIYLKLRENIIKGHRKLIKRKTKDPDFF